MLIDYQQLETHKAIVWQQLLRHRLPAEVAATLGCHAAAAGGEGGGTPADIKKGLKWVSAVSLSAACATEPHPVVSLTHDNTGSPTRAGPAC